MFNQSYNLSKNSLSLLFYSLTTIIKFIGLIIFFSLVIIFIYNSNYNNELNSFLDNRILELFTINNKNIENISSGYTEYRENVLQQFLNSNPITYNFRNRI